MCLINDICDPVESIRRTVHAVREYLMCVLSRGCKLCVNSVLSSVVKNKDYSKKNQKQLGGGVVRIFADCQPAYFIIRRVFFHLNGLLPVFIFYGLKAFYYLIGVYRSLSRTQLRTVRGIYSHCEYLSRFVVLRSTEIALVS